MERTGRRDPPRGARSSGYPPDRVEWPRCRERGHALRADAAAGARHRRWPPRPFRTDRVGCPRVGSAVSAIGAPPRQVGSSQSRARSRSPNGAHPSCGSTGDGRRRVPCRRPPHAVLCGRARRQSPTRRSLRRSPPPRRRPRAEDGENSRVDLAKGVGSGQGDRWLESKKSSTDSVAEIEVVVPPNTSAHSAVDPAQV